MNRSTTPLRGATAPNLDQAQQLVIRFFAWVDGCASKPPERALWRVLLDFTLRAAPSNAFIVYGRAMRPSTVHHTALTIYTMSDRAGIAHATDREIAEQARLEEKIIAKAIRVLNRAYVIRTTRDDRRGARFHAMNIGGLDWTAIRHRASRRRRRDQQPPATARLPLTAIDASGVHSTPLSGVHSTPLRGHVRTGQISTSQAAAELPAHAREATAQEQQPDRSTLDGLITAIAARSREHDLPCSEDGIRDRVSTGVLKVEDLRRYLEEVLPPRMNDGGPEAAERWKADEAAGRVDRTRVGGYPAPPDDPRFTTAYAAAAPEEE